MQIYWNKRKCLQRKNSTPTGLVWDTDMAAVSLFWDTSMAAVTSCENTLLKNKAGVSSDIDGQLKTHCTVLVLRSISPPD